MSNVSTLLMMICLGLAISASGQSIPDVQKSLSEAAGFLQSGDFSAAEKILLQARRSSPNNSDVHNLLGIIYDQKSDFVSAEREYRTSIRLSAKAISPLANLGILLSRTGREKIAVQTFESVLRLNPNHPQTIINLGLLYHTVGNFPLAIIFLEKANLIQPDNYDILFKLAVSLYKTKNLNRAKQILETINPANRSSRSFYYLGLIAYNQNSDALAVQQFENALALEPGLADANFMLGEIMSRHFDYVGAKGFYQRAIQADRLKPVYLIRLGGTLLFLKDYSGSLDIFTEAAKRFPEIPEIRYFLAIAERTNGNFDLALVAVQQAILLKPRYADALALSGAIRFDKNELGTAEKDLRRAIALSPNNFNANNDLGRLLIKQQRFSEALPIFERAAIIDPTKPDVHYQLFLIYSRLKLKAEADQELTIFKQLSGNK